MKKITPNDPLSHSKDLVSENIQKLKQIFPEIFTEGNNIDFEALENVLGEYKETGAERYQFTWSGKAQARREAQKVSTGTLRPCPEESEDWDTTQNLYIEGDNLEVLKLLQKSYHNKVKMIYIDPPYNTGNDFVYKDDYKDNLQNYLKLTGQKDTEGVKTSTNTETSGHYHSNWLNMMYPRLKLARNLLEEDGVIFISIDDSEVENLKKIGNEIFGEDNFINQISIKAKASSGASGGGEDRRLKKNIEYLLIYAKSSKFESFYPIYKYQLLNEYINVRKKQGKNFAYKSVLVKSGKEEYFKTIKAGNGEDIIIKKVTDYEVKSISKLSKEKKIEEYDVYLNYFEQVFTLENAQTSIRDRVLDACGKDDDFYYCYYKPVSGKNKGKMTKVGFMGATKRLVSFLNNVAERTNDDIIKKDKIGTLWDDLSWSSVSLEGGVKFNNGKKPVALINRIIELYPIKNTIILDFFSGIATTAHSVFIQNAKKFLNQRFILVQLPEDLDENLKHTKSKKTKKEIKSLIEFLDSINKPHLVTELGKERIRRAANKIREELEAKKTKGEISFEEDKQANSSLDLGFKVFKLDSSNIRTWDPETKDLEQSLWDSVNNIKEDRSEEDVLYEILLKYGLDLTLPMEEYVLAGKKVFSIGFGALITCLADNITLETVEEIGKLKNKLNPEICRVVFKDNGFPDDVAKTNAMQILKRYKIEEVVSI